MKNFNFMRYVVFIIWLLATVFLIFTVIGMLLFVPSFEANRRSSWMQLGMDLKDKML